MNRRSFLLGAAGILAAPAIVRASSLMPVSVASSLWPASSNLEGVWFLGHPVGPPGFWYADAAGKFIWVSEP